MPMEYEITNDVICGAVQQFEYGGDKGAEEIKAPKVKFLHTEQQGKHTIDLNRYQNVWCNHTNALMLFLNRTEETSQAGPS